MARKKNSGVAQTERPVKAKKNSSSSVTHQNSFGEAIGFPGTNGLPNFGNQNSYAPQISQTNTLFANMRWYLASNMRQPLSEAYVEIGLIQAICDVPVDDGLRGGITINSKQLDEDQIKELQISLDRDDDLNTAGQSAKWNRLYGGAGILILTDDQDPEEPLDIAAITKDSNVQFRAVDMWELFWDKQNTEGYDPATQTQDFEYYSYYSEKLHKSRVMPLTGITAPSFIRPRLRGWGFSCIETLIRSINQYLKATDLAFECLDEFKVDVYKIKNLVNTLLSPTGREKVADRIRMANWQKDYQNALVMDSEDDWDHKQLSFAGLAETMQGIRMQVASDMRMPISKLFGTTASTGLGTTDQNDMENYNSMVEAQVRNKLKYHIVQMIEIKSQALFGFIPDDLEIEFKPLRVLSEKEEEEVKNAIFSRALQAATAGLITVKDFKESCNKKNLLPVQLDVSGDDLTLPEIQAGSAAEAGEGKPGADRIETEASPAGITKSKTKDEYGGEPAKINAVKNSLGFEKAAYEADGGDRWTTHLLFTEAPLRGDMDLWRRAKVASVKIFDQLNYNFVNWYYKKYGGKFHEV